MQILFRILILITLALLGGLLYAVSANLLVILNLIPTDNDAASNFGYEMTSKATIIWIISVVIGIASVFIKQKWRYVLLACPLLAPSLFAFLYALSA